MKQNREETISDFATRLLDTADYAYEEENHSAKNQILLDVFIQGLMIDEIAFEISKESPTTFEDAYKKAMSLEGIYIARKVPRKQVSEENVFNLTTNSPEKRNEEYANSSLWCKNCKKNNHTIRQCFTVECRRCKRIGHIEMDCPSDPKNKHIQNLRPQQFDRMTNQRSYRPTYGGPRMDVPQRVNIYPRQNYPEQRINSYPTNNHPSRKPDWFNRQQCSSDADIERVVKRVRNGQVSNNNDYQSQNFQ